MRRLPTVVALVVALAGSAVTGVVAASAAPTAPTAPAAFAAPLGSLAGAYVPLAPARALDTREPDGGGALAAGETRRLDLTERVSPSTAVAVVLTLTVTEPTAPGYVTVFPAGAARPTASNINFRAGEIRSNSVTVALPAAGQARALSIYNFSGSTQVVVDLLGYYDAGDVADDTTYVPAPTPFRQLDTRDGDRRLAAGQSVDVVIPPGGGRVPKAAALALNVTAVSPSGQGFLTAWSGEGERPPVSTVNYGTDPVTPNFAIVPVQATGNGYRFRVSNDIAATDVLVDVLGYYVPGTSGDLYRAVSPVRIVDTRLGGGGGALQADETRAVTATGTPSATAFVVNVTAVDASASTFLTAYGSPTGNPNRPDVSTLNPFTPFALANAVQLTVRPTGAGPQPPYGFSVYNLAGRVDVVADLQGWFVPFD